MRLGRPLESAAAFQWRVDDHDQRRVERRPLNADMAADVYCSWGLSTRAYLSERMGQPVEAERVYVAKAERYDEARVLCSRRFLLPDGSIPEGLGAL